MRRFFILLAICGALAVPVACIPLAVREDHARRAAAIDRMESDYKALLENPAATQPEKDKALAALSAAKNDLAAAKENARVEANDRALGYVQSVLESAGPLVAIFLPVIGRVLVSASSFIGGLRLVKS